MCPGDASSNLRLWAGLCCIKAWTIGRGCTAAVNLAPAAAAVKIITL